MGSLDDGIDDLASGDVAEGELRRCLAADRRNDISVSATGIAVSVGDRVRAGAARDREGADDLGRVDRIGRSEFVILNVYGRRNQMLLFPGIFAPRRADVALAEQGNEFSPRQSDDR